MKKSIILGIVLVILGLLTCTCKKYLIYTDTIETSGIYYFSVDSGENIYIATEDEISVIQDGHPQRKIHLDWVSTNNGWYFCIENDELIVAYEAGDSCERFDLEGNKLPAGDANFDEVKAAALKREVSVNGHDYEMNPHFGFKPYTITRDGVEVYRMSALDFIFNGKPFYIFAALIMLGAVISFLMNIPEPELQRVAEKNIFVVAFLKRYRKRKGYK